MWQLVEQSADWLAGRYSAKVHFSRLDAGLSELKRDNLSLAIQNVLAIVTGLNSPPRGVAEVYERGSDLVVTYEEISDRAVRPQVYWRNVTLVEQPDSAACELVLSMQTHLLDSNPTVALESRYEAAELLIATGEGCQEFQPLPVRDLTSELGRETGCLTILARLPDQKTSYVEMIHPSDFCGATIIRSGSHVATRSPLFAERLEKGVIRRGRALAAFVPRENDIKLAQGVAAEFLRSPIPLTT